MRIVSFDLFDTLLTRLVAHPYDIFQEVAVRLQTQGLLASSALPSFASQRVDAEIAASQRLSHREASLDHIYDQLATELNWSPDQRSRAASVELAVEREHIRVVPCAKAILDQARAQSDRIYFLSDMYLPSSFLRQILEDDGLFQLGDVIVLSNEVQANKATGHLYARLKSQIGKVTDWQHHGDNLHSDIKMARAAGLQAIHFSRCSLTRYEKLFRSESMSAPPLWRSKFAGAMRYTRLCNPADGQHATIWDTGAQFVGPLLFAAVFWLLETAREKNIRRLYFLSRDGFILQKIADILIARWDYQIETRYFYASRLALQTSSPNLLDPDQQKWVTVPGGDMSLRTCLASIGLEPQEVSDALGSGSFPADAWDRPLPLDRREQLWSLITRDPIAQKAREKAAARRLLARQYAREQGMFDDIHWAMVDIGWHGNLQKALQLLLERDDFLGLYFGLFWDQVPLNDRFLDFWSTFDSPRELAFRNMTFFELFTAAPHGSVTGYQAASGQVQPILTEPVENEVVAWGLNRLHASILHFTDTLSTLVRPPDLPQGDLFHLVRQAYDLFYFQPSRKEAAVWGTFPRKPGANEINKGCLAPAWGELQIIRALADYSSRPTSWWMAGTNARRFSPSLSLYLKARAWKHRRALAKH